MVKWVLGGASLIWIPVISLVWPKVVRSLASSFLLLIFVCGVLFMLLVTTVVQLFSWVLLLYL